MCPLADFALVVTSVRLMQQIIPQFLNTDRFEFDFEQKPKNAMVNKRNIYIEIFPLSTTKSSGCVALKQTKFNLSKMYTFSRKQFLKLKRNNTDLKLIYFSNEARRTKSCLR